MRTECYMLFLPASDQTQVETFDTKLQEEIRKYNQKNMDGEFQSPLKIGLSVLYLDAFDQDLRVRWRNLPDRHLGNNSAASVMILKAPRIRPLLYLVPEWI